MKGQAALEFIFIILIVIVYLTTVTMPLVKDAQNILADVESIGRGNNEAQKIANSINEVWTMGDGSRQTLNIFLPANTTLRCADNNISFEATLLQRPFPSQCPQGVCQKYFPSPTGASLNCITELIEGPQKTNLRIEKAEAVITITQTS